MVDELGRCQQKSRGLTTGSSPRFGMSISSKNLTCDWQRSSWFGMSNGHESMNLYKLKAWVSNTYKKKPSHEHGRRLGVLGTFCLRQCSTAGPWSLNSNVWFGTWYSRQITFPGIWESGSHAGAIITSCSSAECKFWNHCVCGTLESDACLGLLTINLCIFTGVTISYGTYHHILYDVLSVKWLIHQLKFGEGHHFESKQFGINHGSMPTKNPTHSWNCKHVAMTTRMDWMNIESYGINLNP